MEPDNVSELIDKGIDPQRWKAISDLKSHTDVIERIASALAEEFGTEKALDIGFHLSDWAADGLALIALHLAPQRFSDEEVRAIVENMAIHANHHLMAATHLMGEPLHDVFELGLEIETA